MIVKTNIIRGAVCGILILGLAAQFPWGKPADASTIDLGAIVQRDIPGWRSEDLPVADSPEMKKQMNALLNYDGAILREYRQGGRAFLLYASYWNPGRMSPVQIAVHTPDNCWVGNGMIRDEEKSAELNELGGQQVLTGAIRSFSISGSEVEVAYWLTADGQSYTGLQDDHFVSALAQRLHFAWRAIRLQLKRSNPAARIYYVRISTQGDLRALLVDPSLSEFWRAVRQLGLNPTLNS